MKHSILRLTITVAMATLATTAMAQVPPTSAPTDPQPRVNEVDQRLQNQQNRVNAGVADGKISSTAAAADDAKISKEQNRVSEDEAAHDGHLTKGETGRMNDRLNRGGRHIRRQGSSTATPAS